MYATTYKNGNALIHPEGCYCGTWNEFLVDLYYIDDLNSVDLLESNVYGNDYATVPLLICGPSGVYVYEISPEDYEAAQRGACFRLYANRDYEIFNVPSHYASYDVTIHGKRGVVYMLCAEKWDYVDAENLDRAEMCGCVRLGTRPQYAPEMHGIALFVPYGIPYGHE